MKRAIKIILANIKKFNKNTAEFLNNRYFYAWISELWCALRFGCSPDDYFRYRFYEKSNYERNKFITYRRSKKIIKKYSSSDACNIFEDKIKFNENFFDFIGRKWIDLKTSSQDEFENFVKEHDCVLMKPIRGGRGKGIFKLCYDEFAKNNINIDDYRGFLAEQFLTQHEVMSRLNPTSVNTLRVLTFQGEIIACALRTGSAGAIVDNLKSNGVCAHIDVETGVIDNKCIDMSFNKYIYHPDTKAQMVGIKIPNWENLKSFVHKATKIIPEVKYIGWDVAVLENGFAIIEGNHDPGHSIVQMIAQTGLYDKIRDIECKNQTK